MIINKPYSFGGFGGFEEKVDKYLLLRPVDFKMLNINNS
jgi:hypothetical protein